MRQSEENHAHISKIIDQTFELVKLTYQRHNAASISGQPLTCSDTGSRLIFPKNRKGNTRVSEQELRFAFVEVFNQYVRKNGLSWFYSVEEPTRCDYGFSGKGQRNALFDLSIVDSHFNRIALIEFKEGNPEKKCYEKDFEKLANPEESDINTLKYFLQIVENHNKNTPESITRKTDIDNTSLMEKRDSVYHRVYSISKGKEIINKTIN